MNDEDRVTIQKSDPLPSPSALVCSAWCVKNERILGMRLQYKCFFRNPRLSYFERYHLTSPHQPSTYIQCILYKQLVCSHGEYQWCLQRREEKCYSVTLTLTGGRKDRDKYLIYLGGECWSAQSQCEITNYLLLHTNLIYGLCYHLSLTGKPPPTFHLSLLSALRVEGWGVVI